MGFNAIFLQVLHNKNFVVLSFALSSHQDLLTVAKLVQLVFYFTVIHSN